MIAFVSGWDIYLMNADGTDIRQLTDHSSRDAWPTWSPDGKQITFMSERKGQWNVFVMDVDVGESSVRRLTSSNNINWEPAWSPDGAWLAFGSSRNGNSDVYVRSVDASDREERRLTTHSQVDGYPCWSPDGAPDGGRIAFVSDRDGNWEIYTMTVPDGTDAGGSDVRRLTNNDADDWDPDWSPDGTQIAFASGRDGNMEIYVVTVPDGMDVAGSDLRRLTDHPADDMNPSWSPDGTQIAFHREERGQSIYLVNADGSNQRELATGSKSGSNPVWRPDPTAQPANAEPASLYFGEGPVVVDGYAFVEAFFRLLYSTDAIPWIPYLIDQASQGEYPEESIFAVPDRSTMGTGMHYSVWCREEMAFESQEQAVTLAAELPPVFGELFADAYDWAVCASWQASIADPIENEAVVSDIPTLVLSGRYDPVTPPAWGRLAAETLANSFVYEFPNVAHGTMRSNSCALEIGLQFLDDPTVEPDTSCLDRLGSPEFR